MNEESHFTATVEQMKATDWVSGIPKTYQLGEVQAIGNGRLLLKCEHLPDLRFDWVYRRWVPATQCPTT
jgi:hypothetical protein